jgi:hypothetical protein
MMAMAWLSCFCTGTGELNIRSTISVFTLET